MTTPLGAIIGYARTSTSDQQAGLDAQIAELQATGCTRIFSEQVSGADLSHGDLHLDIRTRKARVGDHAVELSAREFALAEELIRHAGQVLSREQLLSRVWGYDFDPGSNVADVYVGYLRQKIGAARIETVRGVGYRLT